MVRKLSLTQGTSKVTRDIFPVFDAQLPGDANEKVCVSVPIHVASSTNGITKPIQRAGTHCRVEYGTVAA
jgi:hypothetical protein